ncbi:transposase [Bradyrhizobium sp. GM0.4]
MARKHGATRWQIYDWRRRFRRRGMLPPCEASQPTFAPLVVEGALEERQVPAIKLEIAMEMLRLDPFSGAAIVFRSKRADRIKILVWDRTGLMLVHKRLEGASSFGQRLRTA